MNVHNHGPNQGRGLGCEEHLVGECMVDEIKQEALLDYIRTKETPVMTLKADTPAVEAIIKAWVDEGVNLQYHRYMQRELRATWPTLANALDRLAPPRAK